MLTEAGCSARRKRLQYLMAERGWTLFTTHDPRAVYYFTGRFSPEAAEPFSLGAGSDAPDTEQAAAAVLSLRRRSDADEIAEIRESLRLCAIAYDTARSVIRPGLTEREVFDAMHAAIESAHGGPVPFPGDFACGLRSVRGGGPPTDRVLEAGDLFPLDLFPAPAFYAGDTCRTFCVGHPNVRQTEAWRITCDALALAESLVRPGVACADVYSQVKQFLDGIPATEASFWHHLGHGIGIHGHEAPRFIPESTDVLEPGDVFTLEPGVYVEANQGGIRLENNYIVTETGIEKIFDYPLDMEVA